MSNLSGYGPANKYRLYFDGNQSGYEIWEVKFLAHLRLQNLFDVIEEAVPDVGKNARVYAELVLLLDDVSLSLVMRDAKENGKKAIDILREHYSGKSKPRIISLYGELASLKMTASESVTDYVIRAETSATSLKMAGETISDSLLIAMCLKGLPSEFHSFATVITQKEDDPDFVKFKSSLRSFEESEKSRKQHNDMDNVMKFSNNNMVCFKCHQPGHKIYNCPQVSRNSGNMFEKSKHEKSGRWCTHCKSSTHDTEYCRRKKNKTHAKMSSDTNENKRHDDNNHSFAFKVNCENEIYYKNENSDVLSKCVLVDTGATSHIISDKDKFIRYDENFDPKTHYIELADGSRSNNVVKAKGDASVTVCDSKGVSHDIVLTNALYVPSYGQDIFSVHSATERGASVNFYPDVAQLVTPDGTHFDIEKKGKLYFLNNVKSGTETSKSLSEWHNVLGHCNVNYILKLEKCVKGMKITNKSDAKNFQCDVCIKGKMCQYVDRSPHKRAGKLLEHVHNDLAGSITPVARELFKCYFFVFY